MVLKSIIWGQHPCPKWAHQKFSENETNKSPVLPTGIRLRWTKKDISVNKIICFKNISSDNYNWQPFRLVLTMDTFLGKFWTQIYACGNSLYSFMSEKQYLVCYKNYRNFLCGSNFGDQVSVLHGFVKAVSEKQMLQNQNSALESKQTNLCNYWLRY